VASGHNDAVKNGFRLNLKYSFFIFLASIVLFFYYAWNGNMNLAIGFLLGGCTTPFINSFNLYLPLLLGKKDFRLAAVYGEFLTNIVPAVAVGLVAYFYPSILWLLVAYFMSNLTVTAYTYYKSVKKYKQDENEKNDSQIFNYSKHLSYINILNSIAGNIDQVFLFHFVGPVEVALYNFATAIPDQTKGPFKTLDYMIQTRFAKRTDREIQAGMGFKALVFTLVAAVFIVIYVLLAPFIFKYLFPNYMDAVFYSQIFSLSLLTSFAGPAGSYLSINKRIKEQYTLSVSTSIFSIASYFVGAIYAGLWGIIIARMLNRVFGQTLLYGLYLKAVKENK
jgi:O-antigen/teichoic acid export membrane protein